MTNFGLLKTIGVGILPAIVVGISMFVAHNVFIAMFVMHWTVMVLVPICIVLYTQGKAGLSWYKEYLRQQAPLSDLRISLGLFVFGTLVAFGSYALNSCQTIDWDLCIGSVNSNIANYGFQNSPNWLIILCAAYFPIVNPLIEELFWRVFMDHEYTLTEEPALIEEESMILAATESGNPKSPAIISTRTSEVPLKIRVLFSCLYASYHTMVVGVFLGGVQFGILAFFLLTGLGLIFHYIFSVSEPQYAYVRAVALHSGIDLGVVIALGDAVGWYSIVT